MVFVRCSTTKGHTKALAWIARRLGIAFRRDRSRSECRSSSTNPTFRRRLSTAEGNVKARCLVEIVQDAVRERSHLVCMRRAAVLLLLLATGCATRPAVRGDLHALL